ncbi:MAG: hypothetical protein AABX34_00165, partial [Nanoarchaeota archaeon]
VNRAFGNMKGDFTEAFFKKQIAAPMHLRLSSVAGYTGPYKRGYIYGSASSTPLNLQDRLDKTSIFLYALGFSEDDELQGKVINGIRERAAERDYQFEYPPPEDKRISYEEIKRAYITQNNVVEGISAEEKNGNKEESVADRVNRLLTMPISDKPDNKHYYRDMIAREVYIENFTNDNTDVNVGVRIKVAPQQSAAGEALHSDTYRVSYSGYPGGKEDGPRTWRALKEFLSQTKGQKTRIVYDRRLDRAQRISDIRMIAPVGSEVVYIRDNRILKPYNTRENKFIGV